MTKPVLEYPVGEKSNTLADGRELMRLTLKEKHLINCLRANPNMLVLIKVSPIGQPETAYAIDAMLNVL